MVKLPGSSKRGKPYSFLGLNGQVEDTTLWDPGKNWRPARGALLQELWPRTTTEANETGRELWGKHLDLSQLSLFFSCLPVSEPYLLNNPFSNFSAVNEGARE